MALGLAMLIILGLLVDDVFRRVRIPGLVGMMGVGVVLGPCVLAVLDPALLAFSADFRMIALIVILLRAGFELRKDTLRRVGVQAVWLSFVPATLEALAVMALGPRWLGLSVLESAILGTVLGAVSPAVVVPMMLDFQARRMGTDKGIPTMVIAASSIDDVFVIVVFTSLLGMYMGGPVDLAWTLAGIPVSIALGTGAGLGCGWILYRVFRRFNPRATKRLLAILGVSIVLVGIEPHVESVVPFAALLAVMGIGAIILAKSEPMAHEISGKLAKVWVFAQILLFTLVGAQVDVGVAWQAGLAGSALIGLALVARSAGTWLCLLGSPLTAAERGFVVIAYLPKATVQAAIGGVPLVAMQAAGMPTGPGQVILAVAVLGILLTAPLGAWAIAVAGKRLLKQEPMPLEGGD
jgi:solute carrier family 9B (sodium/hydrogen exchanger), member 1/2